MCHHEVCVTMRCVCHHEVCITMRCVCDRYNMSYLEQWVRDHKLQESGALAALQPCIQASQLLQARKTDSDVDSICEMCSQLTTSQVSHSVSLRHYVCSDVTIRVCSTMCASMSQCLPPSILIRRRALI